MNFFSDERASELRDLFFESAQELLQALNEAGLELEQRPSDVEMIRTIRRTVHTLKGDSAACGFRQLSELAHQLEDVLTPEIAARSDASVAQVILSAADVFDAMLAAYRGNLQLPDVASLLEAIQGIARHAEKRPDDCRANEVVPPEQAASAAAAGSACATSDSGLQPAFLWSEYEQLVIRQAADGRPLFNLAVAIDRQCPFRAAGVQLVRNVMQECGKVLIVVPEDGAAADKIEKIEAVICSDRDEQWIARKCTVPAVVSGVVVRPFTASAEVSQSTVPEAGKSALAPQAAEANSESETLSDSGPQREESLGEARLAAEELPASTAHVVSENTLRVDAERIDTVLNLVGELIIAKSMFTQVVGEFSRRFQKDPLRHKLADMLAHQSQVLNELQRSVMKIRMVPVEQLFRRFPRVVRDLSKLTGKKVVLELTGQDTDLDKSILDALAEPLSHLVRNAVDHGIETPEERLAAGKSAEGMLRLNAFHQGNHVVIEISDNGRGIDRQAVVAKALQLGLVTPEQLERMTEGEILELVFEPGFSTAEQVTEISGRGVGLDVVKIVLERMKGTVSIHTRPGAGTTFQLKVPLTLAIIKALLFRVGGQLYAVPLGTVLEIARARESEIHRVDNHEVLRLRGEVLTLIRLCRLRDIQAGSSAGNKAFIIVVAIADRKFGLVVDALVGEEELVIKALDNPLVSTELVSGASVLGDGAVVLILNLAATVEQLGRIRGVSVENGADTYHSQECVAMRPEPETEHDMRANP